MKSKIILVICMFLGSFYATSQNACDTYYPFKKGVQFEITSFNPKGKKESVATYKVLTIENNTATIETSVSDEKGKDITTSTFQVTCNGNGISIDFKSLMNADLMKQYKDVDLDMTGTNIEFPNDLQVGQTLNDANLKMTMNMGGMKMNMTVAITNRKVNAKETITTPAGTFNCYALSSTSETKMGIKMAFEIKEWVAEGVGVIKSETYNKSGKLMGYTELTNMTK